MGEMLREFWTPALRSASLERDGAPRRVRLLGQDFVAFRATDGRVGFLNERCPHRCASLSLARNEGNGLRCIFHGWKIDVSGKVVDAPSEPPDRRAQFAAGVPVHHYPTREAGGLVWAYLGRRATAPNSSISRFTAHLRNRSSAAPRCTATGSRGSRGSSTARISACCTAARSHRARRGAATMALSRFSRQNTSPRFEMIDTPYGFREAALRELEDQTVYARIREVVFPYWSFIPGEHGEPRLVVVVVPIDDEWSAHWYYYMSPFGPVPDAYREQMLWGTAEDDDDYAADRGSVANGWHQDRQAMSGGHWSGIMKNFTYEDFIIEESMGPIADRTQEYLGSSDAVIVRARRMFLDALAAHQAGALPFGLSDDLDYSCIRALAIHYPNGTDWRQIDPLAPPSF
jgi:nitrite reductase/ring-hydroxylating ferredoxin subunit